uniref:Uncharacterized protein n=1 Tax=Rhizophora mucronata TaxID=61149 RepID=A0A2P2JPT3_RHIMU
MDCKIKYSTSGATHYNRGRWKLP